MKNIARHHHFIPQFYLNGFILNEGKNTQVYVIDKTKKTLFRTSIRNVGGKRDFNRVDVKGQSIDSLEKAYSNFETRVKSVIGYISKTKSLPKDEDFSILMQFVALIGLRNPQIRKSIGGVQEKILEAVTNNLVSSREEFEKILERMKKDGKSLRNETSYEQIKDFVDNKRYKVHIPNEFFISLELKSLKMVLPLLFERKWSLLITSDDIGNFITSDRPLSLVWSDNKNNNNFWGPGFGLTGTELIFPLNKNISLLGIFEEITNVMNVDEKMTAIINGRTIAFADRFIYSSKPNFKYMNNDRKICDASDLIK